MPVPQVALVTGATRGAGKGIALGLAAKGMTVYVTGRSSQCASATLKGEILPGTLTDTVADINAAGGTGMGVTCDHADDEQTRAVIEQIEQEQGRLDVLVNNAAHIDDTLIDPGGFWEKPLDLANILDVGLRSAYVASYHAAPLMIGNHYGLITFTSSFGGVCYMHGPAYGAQKAGYDKFAADMAVDLENENVAAVSLWLGPPAHGNEPTWCCVIEGNSTTNSWPLPKHLSSMAMSFTPWQWMTNACRNRVEP